MNRFLSLATIAVLVLFVNVALADEEFKHPAAGFLPFEVNLDYGKPNYGFQADMNFGKVTFAKLPPRSSLSDIERYMLAGSTSSSFGHPLSDWYTTIWGHVCAYYEKTGELPERLTPEAVMKANGLGAFKRAPEWLDEIKNPITGEYPLITSEEFSPGDLYVHILTPAEIAYYAAKVPIYRERWLLQKTEDPSTGTDKRIRISSPIMYIRVYGEHSVIENHIIFSSTDR
ncbi:hypothetical protein IT575_13415 [bacterium]|nr:hypothetical protein [bacterium]